MVWPWADGADGEIPGFPLFVPGSTRYPPLKREGFPRRRLALPLRQLAFVPLRFDRDGEPLDREDGFAVVVSGVFARDPLKTQLLSESRLTLS